MAELVRGSVADRPWGRTFATLALRGVTGQLTLASEGKRFAVAFERGAVVAAMSPLAADAAVRVALTAHLISSSQVPEISRRQAATPDRDEIDVIAELARLGPEHALRLRRRAIAQRAARTFSVNQGDFVVTDDTELLIVDGCELDVRAVIYIGARANLSEQRLASELDQLGAWFRLKPAYDDDLPQFGFTDLEQPIVERLRDGGTLDDLEAFAASFVDGRTVRAVVYALASYNACDIELVPPAGSRSRPPMGAVPASRSVETQPLPRRTHPPTPGPGPGGAAPTQPMPRTMTPPADGPRSSGPTPSPPPVRTTIPPVPMRGASQVTSRLATSPPPLRPPATPAGPAEEAAHDTFEIPVIHDSESAAGDPRSAEEAPRISAAGRSGSEDTVRWRDSSSAGLRIPADPGPQRSRRVTAAPGETAEQRMTPVPGEAAERRVTPVPGEAAERRATPVPGVLRERRVTRVPGEVPERVTPVPGALRERRTPTPGDLRDRRETPPGVEPLSRGRDSSPFAQDPRGRDTPPHGLDPRRPLRADGSDPELKRPDDAESGLTVLRRRIASSRQPALRQVGRADSAKSHEVKALIAQRLKLLDQGADHFQLLGIAQDASSDLLRRAYFALARQLHPDRLAALGISDDGKHAQRLFAEINAGFAILSDQTRRAEYLHVLRSGGEAAVRAEQAKAEQLARQILEAEEAFRRGEMALRRDQPQAAVAELERAVQQNPDEADYHALLAWARFAAASDKQAVATATRQALDKAIERAPKAVAARFYLGRVERMLGRDADAHRLFRAVLAASPGHAEAAAELRVLESRMTAGKPPRR